MTPQWDLCLNSLHPQSYPHAQKKKVEVTCSAMFREAIMEGSICGSVLIFNQQLDPTVSSLDHNKTGEAHKKK